MHDVRLARVTGSQLQHSALSALAWTGMS